jgi:hypothetical protein
VAEGRIPDYGKNHNLHTYVYVMGITQHSNLLFFAGPISSSFDGFFVVIYVTYFGLAICMIVGGHTVSNKSYLNNTYIRICISQSGHV